eukprot:TRINITY_DN5798_c0_g1_i3.p2 TRINITY_DN5798_c0_g1~~TRINITY_DN5798_c0_g1_i3.p2  ORF type:complete len:215 (-),score=57.52 TRINITY_DN5798_c0_g1_i3:894-1538(-)
MRRVKSIIFTFTNNDIIEMFASENQPEVLHDEQHSKFTVLEAGSYVIDRMKRKIGIGQPGDFPDIDEPMVDFLKQIHRETYSYLLEDLQEFIDQFNEENYPYAIQNVLGYNINIKMEDMFQDDDYLQYDEGGYDGDDQYSFKNASLDINNTHEAMFTIEDGSFPENLYEIPIDGFFNEDDHNVTFVLSKDDIKEYKLYNINRGKEVCQAIIMLL